MKGKTMRRHIAIAALAAVLIAGCTSGESSSDTTTTEGGEPPPSGPAPGVTADAVEIGVTYVDLESVREVTDIDHGDYEAAYQVLFDEINENGGIHGRLIEPIYAPVNPIGTAPAEEACVRLTQDDEVFMAVGAFLADTVLCYVETNATAVLGGVITPERLARAEAPWFSTEASADLQEDAIRTLADEGYLDGNLAVVSLGSEEQDLRQVVEPLLAELELEPVEVGVIDAPQDDVAAQNAAVGILTERFRAAGADTLLVIGNAGLTWANGSEQTTYRPELRFTALGPIQAFSQSDAGPDLSILDGAVAGALEADFDEEGSLACVEKVGDALGIEILRSAEVPDGEPDHFSSVGNACRNVAVLEALLEAAGEDLNYGTLVAGAEGLSVAVPGYTDAFVFGSGNAGDGDPAPTLLEWDAGSGAFVIIGD